LTAQVSTVKGDVYPRLNKNHLSINKAINFGDHANHDNWHDAQFF